VSKKPKRNVASGLVILNKYGDVWTPHIFDTEAQAHAHAKASWGERIASFNYEVVPGYAVVGAGKPPRVRSP
jgi:hypothetical protein